MADDKLKTADSELVHETESGQPPMALEDSSPVEVQNLDTHQDDASYPGHLQIGLILTALALSIFLIGLVSLNTWTETAGSP